MGLVAPGCHLFCNCLIRGRPRKGFDLGHLLNKPSRLTPTGANQTTSTKGGGGSTCSQMTISKILSLGHCLPQLGQRSGSRGTGGAGSSLIKNGGFPPSPPDEKTTDHIVLFLFF